MRNMSPINRTVETELAQKSKFVKDRREGETPQRIVNRFFYSKHQPDQ